MIILLYFCRAVRRRNACAQGQGAGRSAQGCCLLGSAARLKAAGWWLLHTGEYQHVAAPARLQRRALRGAPLEEKNFLFWKILSSHCTVCTCAATSGEYDPMCAMRRDSCTRKSSERIHHSHIRSTSTVFIDAITRSATGNADASALVSQIQQRNWSKTKRSALQPRTRVQRVGDSIQKCGSEQRAQRAVTGSGTRAGGVAAGGPSSGPSRGPSSGPSREVGVGHNAVFKQDGGGCARKGHTRRDLSSLHFAKRGRGLRHHLNGRRVESCCFGDCCYCTQAGCGKRHGLRNIRTWSVSTCNNICENIRTWWRHTRISMMSRL